MQTSPVTVDSYMKPGSVMAGVAALGEAVNRLSTSSNPPVSNMPTVKPEPVPGAKTVSVTHQNLPYNQYSSTYLGPERPVNMAHQNAPPVSAANSFSSSIAPSLPNYHFPTTMAPVKGPNADHPAAMNGPIKVKKEKGAKPRKPWSERKAPGKWTKEEDNILRKAVDDYGAKEWKKIAAVLGGARTSVQCLHRWNKVLKPGLVKGPWTKEEVPTMSKCSALMWLLIFTLYARRIVLFLKWLCAMVLVTSNGLSLHNN